MPGRLFLNPGLLVGALLVAVPIAIHLLRRYRYRRVKWAAMEFLLAGQRRTRRRTRLEQWSLLALRCLLVLGIVAIVARPLAGEHLAALVAPGQRSEHWIILDDSYSMSERQGEVDAFTLAKRVAETIVGALVDRPGQHAVTLVRTGSPTAPDLDGARLAREKLADVRAVLERLRVSELADGPTQAVTQVATRALVSAAPRRVVYLVTDFRAKDWSDEGALVDELKRLGDAGIELHFVDAARVARANVGIESLTARLGSGVAGVPLVARAVARNQGPELAARVPATASVDGRATPAQVIERIEPGSAAPARFTLELAEPGWHGLEVALPDDAVGADNHRYLALDLPEKREILIVDGSPGRGDSRYLALALRPGGVARTGLEPVIKGPDFLANASLSRYPVVFLVNVPRLDRTAAVALARYVEAGGGLGIFLGEEVRAADYNAVFGADDSARRLLPFRLARKVELAAPAAARAEADLRPGEHPIMRVFAGERNPFLDTVRVMAYMGLAEGSLAGDAARVVAQTRDGAPLAVETTVGAGRVFWLLTSAGPDWNTWPRNPSFVVAMLELVAHLAEPASPPAPNLVGAPWVFEFAADYRREVSFASPGANLAPGADPMMEARVVVAEPAGSRFRVTFPDTRRAGIYAATLTRASGERETRLRAVNVDPAEGATEKVPPERLRRQLAGIPHRFVDASAFGATGAGAGVEPREWLLVLFVGLLVGEQLLAMRLSHHPRSEAGGTRDARGP